MKIKKSFTIVLTLFLLCSISSCKSKSKLNYNLDKTIPLIRFKDEGNLDKVLEVRNKKLVHLLADNKEDFIKDIKDEEIDLKTDAELDFSNIKVGFNTEEVLNNPLKKEKSIKKDSEKEGKEEKDIIYKKAYSLIDKEKYKKDIDKKVDTKLKGFEKGYYIDIKKEGEDEGKKLKHIKYSSKEAKLLKDILEDTLNKNNLKLEEVQLN